MIKNFLVGPNDSEILVHQTHMHICLNYKQSKVLEITRNLFSIVPKLYWLHRTDIHLC